VRDVQEDHRRQQHVEHHAQDAARGIARPRAVPPLRADARRRGTGDGEDDEEHGRED
jgi:hypothetical protein